MRAWSVILVLSMGACGTTEVPGVPDASMVDAATSPRDATSLDAAPRDDATTPAPDAAEPADANTPAPDAAEPADAGPVDPCANNGGCSADATCTATTTGRICECLPGFSGDGLTCTDVAAALSGLRWQIPCGPPSGNNVCSGAVATVTSTVLAGAPAQTYQVTLRLRGVVELKSYTGGVTSTVTPYFQVGGAPAGDGFNIYRLDVSTPPATYYLNVGVSSIYNCFPIDYAVMIPMNGGATITLSGDPLDGAEIQNVDAAGVPIVIPGIAPAPAAYDGQLIQMDVMSVVRGS